MKLTKIYPVYDIITGPESSGISFKAGFPRHSLDYAEERIDLYQVLVKHPLATFIAQCDRLFHSNYFQNLVATLANTIAQKSGLRPTSNEPASYANSIINLHQR